MQPALYQCGVSRRVHLVASFKRFGCSTQPSFSASLAIRNFAASPFSPRPPPSASPTHRSAPLPSSSSLPPRPSSSSSSLIPFDGKPDLAVIGGGSAGVSTATAAARLGAKVVLFDYVIPSPGAGVRWGVGGTCVNVGCIPKKLMHYSSTLGDQLHDAQVLGWDLPSSSNLTHNGGAPGDLSYPEVANSHRHHWPTLVNAVQSHIKRLNFTYRNALRSSSVHYVNAFASLHSPTEVRVARYTTPPTSPMSPPSSEYLITPRYTLLAVGGRPTVPSDVEGASELAITSDDVFAMRRSPGKTLLVGGGYIAMELAGVLSGHHYPVTMAIRSIPLRSSRFDRQCVDKIVELMERRMPLPVQFLHQYVPLRLTRPRPDGPIEVTFSNLDDGTESVDHFDTVIYATGRSPALNGLGLRKGEVKVNQETAKIVVDESDQTTNPSIFALGDVAREIELTPTAVMAGEKLARRLFAQSQAKMSYDFVPTTVFTPFEYGSVGYSEERANNRFGEENVEVYLKEFSSLELAAVNRPSAPPRDFAPDLTNPDADPTPPPVLPCLTKVVCLRRDIVIKENLCVPTPTRTMGSGANDIECVSVVVALLKRL
eukprot:GHVN01078078.1.p1 GENE.GHVN01078078.1~~GHVN01078078.1.p1  ORF type:complete len:598 (-),score=98.57 GHVN01078078.1:956-2749(-)